MLYKHIIATQNCDTVMKGDIDSDFEGILYDWENVSMYRELLQIFSTVDNEPLDVETLAETLKAHRFTKAEDFKAPVRGAISTWRRKCDKYDISYVRHPNCSENGPHRLCSRRKGPGFKKRNVFWVCPELEDKLKKIPRRLGIDVRKVEIKPESNEKGIKPPPPPPPPRPKLKRQRPPSPVPHTTFLDVFADLEIRPDLFRPLPQPDDAMFSPPLAPPPLTFDTQNPVKNLIDFIFSQEL